MRYFIALVLSVLACTASGRAFSKDHGQYGPIDPKIKKWFDDLRNGNGTLCCDKTDGETLSQAEVDYDTKDGHYRVFLRGQWYEVPDVAHLKGKNLIGRALIWYYFTEDGYLRLFCFLPGPMS